MGSRWSTRAKARSPPQAWMSPQASKVIAKNTEARPAQGALAYMAHDRRRLMPIITAMRPKPATRINDTRFEIVMVKRSLEAANDISAGNRINVAAFASMTTNSLTGRAAADCRRTLTRFSLRFG